MRRVSLGANFLIKRALDYLLHVHEPHCVFCGEQAPSFWPPPSPRGQPGSHLANNLTSRINWHHRNIERVLRRRLVLTTPGSGE